ncbi:dihydropteroate synthase [Listeria grandensis]|uniref:dihydropteroate synthase n=1 Tax=Listeria grandensis TaxID=1494963 RepID=UPI001FD2743E|nr:dihydropteroate synthase [Listeria grandensis]MBC6316688.1 dihydropteroate synthase [Listeria grandensis]
MMSKNELIKQPSLIMGILNITPDSFSDGGKYNTVQDATMHVREMIRDGANIIDIGGVSTRPGYSYVSISEEIKRVIPVIKAVRETFPDVVISVDTWRSEVAELAIQAGANMLNDEWGAKYDRRMAELAKIHNIPICLMHNRSDSNYTNFMEDVKNDLLESVGICKDVGVPDKHIILDPGFGFVKTDKQNLEILRHIDEIVVLGYDVLLATSRKSTIGLVLDLPVHERMEGTGATVVFGISKGCRIFRVHDVKNIARMARMTDAIVGNITI